MPFDRTLRDQLFALFEGPVQRLGCELVGVEIAGGEGRPILRVYVDREGGISVQDCASCSRALSVVLDVEDPMAGAYALEVSSPGIDRPLQRLSDFARFAGYRVKLRLELPQDGRKRFSGTLAGVDGEDILLSSGEQELRLPFPSVEQARLVLDLDEYKRLAEAMPPRAEPTGDSP